VAGHKMAEEVRISYDLCQTALTEGLEVKYLSQINIMTKNSGMN
jgi:hypothetical protein